MKNSFILYGLIAGVSAMPHFGHKAEKRDVVWETKYANVYETHWSTKTVWVDPSEATPSPSAVKAAGFEGYEHPKHQITKTHHKARPQHKTKASSSKSKSSPPPAYTPPAAPSTTSAAQVPTTTSSSTPPPPPPTTSKTSTSVYVAPKPKTTSTPPPPPPPATTSQYVAPSTSQYVAPTTSAAPAPTSTPASSYGSSSSSSSSGGSVPGDAHAGDGTFYTVGMGSCGKTSTDSQPVVAVGHGFMLADYGTGNPNLNPNCGKKIKVHYGGKTVDATIVDTCPGCAGKYDLDMSPSLFKSLANPDLGRIGSVKWWMAD